MFGVRFQNTFSARICANGCTVRGVKTSKWLGEELHAPTHTSKNWTWLNYFFVFLKSLWIWKDREQLECLAFRFKTNIRAKYESLLHIINKLNPLGERQVASGVGRNCCFWRAACFRSEVSSWNGRRVQYFLIKAQQNPKILSRGIQDSWLTPGFLRGGERERERGEPWAHNVLWRHYFTALFPAGLSLHPKSARLHSK